MKNLLLLACCSLFSLVLGSQSIGFDGTDDYINAGSSVKLKMTEEATIQMWVYPTSFPTSTANIIINKEGEYEVGLSHDGILWYAFSNVAPGWMWYLTDITIPLNSWTQFTIAYDNGTIKTYINGASQPHVLIGEGLITDSDPSLNELWIAQRQDVDQIPNTPFQGEIDEIRIWEKSLNPLDIQNNWDTELCGNEDGLILYYKFNHADLGCDVVNYTELELHGVRMGQEGSNNLPQYSENVPGFDNANCFVSNECLSTNTIDIDNDLSINIYPNPAKGILNLEFVNSSSFFQKINITDSFGKVMISLKDVRMPTSINIETLESGLYFLIIDHESRRHLCRFLKI